MFAVIAALLLQAATPLPSASPPASASASAAPSAVVVTGRRPIRPLPDQTRAFAEAVGRPSGQDQLAAWPMNTPICARALGFSPEGARVMRGAVEGVARKAGLMVAGERCGVNVLIVPSDDPLKAALAVQQVVGPIWGEDGPSAMSRTLSKPAPVHWWRIADTIQAAGTRGSDQNFAAAGSKAATDPVKTFNGFDASRIRQQTRRAVSSVVVLIDTRRMAGANAAAFADYVAMGVFAPVGDQPARVDEAPSILGLYKADGTLNEAAPAGMTEWDLAYVKGLYAADPALNSGLANGQIAVTMARALSKDGPVR